MQNPPAVQARRRFGLADARARALGIAIESFSDRLLVTGVLLPYIGDESHVPCPLDRRGDGVLTGR